MHSFYLHWNVMNDPNQSLLSFPSFLFPPLPPSSSLSFCCVVYQFFLSTVCTLKCYKYLPIYTVKPNLLLENFQFPGWFLTTFSNLHYAALFLFTTAQSSESLSYSRTDKIFSVQSLCIVFSSLKFIFLIFHLPGSF